MNEIGVLFETARAPVDPISKPTVLVAGIGGASLGSELMKCLVKARRYSVVGCDISDQAFGHFAGLATLTRTVSAERYIDDVLEFAGACGAAAIIAGAGEPLRLINDSADRFAAAGVRIIGNNVETTRLAEDKRAVATVLERAAVAQPRWAAPASDDDPVLASFSGPVVVKPATGSGASRFVFLADSPQRARVYVRYLLDNGMTPIVQAYLPLDEGEFSIGALSGADGAWIGAIVMRRIFINELSIALKTKAGLLSSSYGQGMFGAFPRIEAEARRIAEALGSTGPLNIQGRVVDGEFIAYEVNARFSGSCYLRAMAGFNEPDIVLGERLFGEVVEAPAVLHGLALRGLSEVFIGQEPIER